MSRLSKRRSPDFNVFASLRKAAPEKQHETPMQSAVRFSLSLLSSNEGKENAYEASAGTDEVENNDARTVTFLKLTDEELVDNEMWKMRFQNNETFRRNYALKLWEKEEMKTIVRFLDLKNPSDFPEFLHGRGQKTTRAAVSSIFFPKPEEHQSVLLKRGTVLFEGEERELMLFTGGFVISRIELDSLLNLLMDVSSGQIESARPKQLQKRFSIVDEDGNGYVDLHEMREFFRFMGIPLSEAVIDGIVKIIDSDSDGKVSFAELRSITEELHRGKPEDKANNAFWGRLRGKRNICRKLDLAFQMSDIDDVRNLGVCQSNASKRFVSFESAPLTLAIFIKNVHAPLLLTCSKPCHVVAWEEAFRVSRLASNASQLAKHVSTQNIEDEGMCRQLDVLHDGKMNSSQACNSSNKAYPAAAHKMNIDYNFSAWDYFRQEISTEKQESLKKSLAGKSSAKTRFHNYIRRMSMASDDSDFDESSAVKKNMTTNPFDLTEEERNENAVWQMRFQCDEVFAKSYVPTWWEKKEMDSIVEFLMLENPSDHPEFLNKPGQQTTKGAVSSIFFSKEEELQPVLLKRGPVLLGGEERELMLFTNGFVFSRVELDALVNLFLNASSSGKLDLLTSDDGLVDHFDEIDADGSGSLERHEVKTCFSGMGIPLTEKVLDDVVKRFDTDSDGLVSFYEFKSMVDEIRTNSGKKNSNDRGSFFRGMGGNLKKALIKDGVTRKLDVAFHMADIEMIENMGVCRNKELKRIVGKRMAPLTLVVYLKDIDIPLVVMCAKPGHVEAWEEAFSKCIQLQGADHAGADAPINNYFEECNASCIDWG